MNLSLGIFIKIKSECTLLYWVIGGDHFAVLGKNYPLEHLIIIGEQLKKHAMPFIYFE